MKDYKLLSTPCILNHKLSSKKNRPPFHDYILYHSIVGMLQYLTFTQPDIVYLINQVSQFMHALTDYHMEAVKHILRYLKAIIGDGHMYIRSNNLGYYLLTYNDANWARGPDEYRWISGYCVYIGKKFISWNSRK